MKTQKQIPILMSAPMVQALLAGRKTQTRRILKHETSKENRHLFEFRTNEHGAVQKAFIGAKQALPDYYRCPYGKPGDILWVREAFRKYCPDVDTDPYQTVTEYLADGGHDCLYESDGDGFQVFNKDGSERMIGWKPSIHMPKAAARIWLQIESVRVERAQDIQTSDCVDEGIEMIGGYWKNYEGGDDFWDTTNQVWPDGARLTAEQSSFRSLWHSINGKESWDENPWLWVVSFKLLSTTGRPESDSSSSDKPAK